MPSSIALMGSVQDVSPHIYLQIVKDERFKLFMKIRKMPS